MAFTLTKQPDGDLSLGNLRGELVTLQPAVSDYPASGYPIVSIPPSTGNIGMDKVLFVIPTGDNSGYVPKWNPVTGKLKILQQNGSTGQLVELSPLTDISAFAFNLLVGGL